MTHTPLTRAQAVRLTGCRLPYGYRWALVTGLQWYPAFGDVAHVWAGSEGVLAVIGMRKQVASESEVA